MPEATTGRAAAGLARRGAGRGAARWEAEASRELPASPRPSGPSAGRPARARAPGASGRRPRGVTRWRGATRRGTRPPAPAVRGPATPPLARGRVGRLSRTTPAPHAPRRFPSPSRPDLPARSSSRRPRGRRRDVASRSARAPRRVAVARTFQRWRRDARRAPRKKRYKQRLRSARRRSPRERAPREFAETRPRARDVLTDYGDGGVTETPFSRGATPPGIEPRASVSTTRLLLPFPYATSPPRPTVSPLALGRPAPRFPLPKTMPRSSRDAQPRPLSPGSPGCRGDRPPSVGSRGGPMRKIFRSQQAHGEQAEASGARRRRPDVNRQRRGEASLHTAVVCVEPTGARRRVRSTNSKGRREHLPPRRDRRRSTDPSQIVLSRSRSRSSLSRARRRGTGRSSSRSTGRSSPSTSPVVMLLRTSSLGRRRRDYAFPSTRWRQARGGAGRRERLAHAPGAAGPRAEAYLSRRIWRSTTRARRC